ncbi:MAG: hypothetical protein WDM80_15690 [Limisphaerales bacterium]
MNQPLTSDFTAGLVNELRAFLALCETVLASVSSENQALSGHSEYQPFSFYQHRKNLLPNLETALTNLRSKRLVWQQTGESERSRCEEVKSFFQAIQGILMKVLMLDRENQQALLRRGLVPAKHLPLVAVQRPHYVANLYQRHTTA